MNLSRFTVNRPVFTTMATCIVIILGLIALFRLPIDLMPDTSLPRLTLSTVFENASPEEVEELLTRPLEEVLAAVPGLEEIVSTSAEGVSSIRLSFVWGTDLNEATNDVRDRMERILARLPEESDRPRIRKFDATGFPIIILGVSGRLDPLEMRSLIDNRILQRLERVPGVAAVDVFGGFEREVRVEVDPDRLRAFNLSLEQVLQALRDANVTIPAGDIAEGRMDVTLRTPGRFLSVDDIRNTVITSREGAPVTVSQVAGVMDTNREVTRIVRINGEPGVRLGVRKQSGTNTVEVARALLEEVERVNRDFGQVTLVPLTDQSVYIQQSINNVVRAIFAGGILAMAVLLFFLRSLLSTLVISTAIPVSIVATFALVYFGGYTLNLMTLGGLALGIGMMVDNAIVVLENIFRRRQEGLDRRNAAIEGSGEVGAAVIASTLTTLAIFLPLIFLEGVTGVLFRQLAYVVAFALLCSLLAALTLVPMLASHLPKRKTREEQRASRFHRLNAWAGAKFEALESGYGNLLGTVLRHRPTVLAGAFLVLAATLLLIPRVGTEFMPAADEGEVRVNAEMAVGTRLEVMNQKMEEIEARVLAAVPETLNHQVSVGSSQFRPGSSAAGEVRLRLVPMAERSRSSARVAEDLRGLLQDIPGVTVRVREGQGLFLLRMAGGDGDERLAIEVRGYDVPTLDALARQARLRLREIPGITDVRISREAGVPQQLVRIDRERAADLGLSVSRVARTLRTAVGGSSAGDYRPAGDDVRIWVRMADADRMDINEVLDLTVPTTNGEQIALRSVVHLEQQRGPVQIERKDQQRVAYVNANLHGRDLGSIVADVRAALEEIPLPANHNFRIGGDYEEQQAAFRELSVSLVLAVLLVFMVLACLYEGFRDPLVVMFSVPLAGIGAILMLFLTGTTLNVQSFIGLIMLGGIVVNNAILIVDQATRLRRDLGWKVAEAVREAGRRRLRPILMTSLTTILALMPLAIGIGEGSEAQAPLARAVIGGLMSSTLITLLVIPTVYSLFHRDANS